MDAQTIAISGLLLTAAGILWAVLRFSHKTTFFFGQISERFESFATSQDRQHSDIDSDLKQIHGRVGEIHKTINQHSTDIEVIKALAKDGKEVV